MEAFSAAIAIAVHRFKSISAVLNCRLDKWSLARGGTMNSIFFWFFLSRTGRISRLEFRLGYLGLLAVNVVLTRMVDYFVFYGRSGFASPWDRSALDHAMIFPLLSVTIILFWPFVAVFIKRLHDINLSGWWWFGTLAIPFVAAIVRLSPTTGFIIMLVVLGSLSGSNGPNRFGPPPPRLRSRFQREPR
ncbi:MAG: DUF805 domain-containing protein [Tardiphaga sp.]